MSFVRLFTRIRFQPPRVHPRWANLRFRRSAHLMAILKPIGAVTVIVGAVAFTSQKVIHNDDKLQAIQLDNEKLVPDASEDTFEMGLYRASERELQDTKEQRRKELASRKYVGFLFRIKFFIDDYVVESLVTLGRFCELAVLFLPVCLSYPMVYFGKMNHKRERSGALIWYKMVRISAEAAGASFIKLGQWAASRTDIFSQGLCDELSRLHSNARSHSYEATRKIIREEFGGLEIEDLFDEFYPTPIGTGAIAQVYLAQVNDNFAHRFIDEKYNSHNSLVAIKVEHPHVRSGIERDLRIMGFFARVIDWLPTMEWLSLPDEVDQFALMMRLQLDMRIEAHNLDKFRKNFAKMNDIKFPAPWFSSRKILIEERIEGVGMDRILKLKRNPMSKQISDKIVDSFLKMMILDNFVHADLHPGNMFVRFVKMRERRIMSTESETDELMTELDGKKLTDEEYTTNLEKLYDEGYRPQVCFIDAGLVTELNDRNRYNFLSLFTALSQFDGYKAGELMIERSRTPETVINPEIFKFKVEKLVDQVRKRTFTLGSISVGDILEQMLSMVRVHHVRMEGDFVTVIVAILLLEGIGRQLDPDLDLFARCVYGWYFGIPTY